MEKIRSLFEKLKYRERALAFTLLSCFAGVCLHFFVVTEISSIRELSRQTSEVRAESEIIHSQLANLGKPRADEARRNPLWKYRRENRGLAGLVRSVTAREDKKSDFTVKKISSEKVERTGDLEKTTLQLDVEAPFNSLGAFLEDLENSDLLTRVESVQITRPERELSLCKARIILNSFNWRDL